jgi:hypothetical protein
MTPPSSQSAAPGKFRQLRRFPRYRTDLPLIVKVLGENGYLRIHGRCNEIAELGLGAVVSAELSPGEMVALEFSLPQGLELSLRAVVRHRMGFLHGFEYVNTPAEQRQSIADYCRNLMLIP